MLFHISYYVNRKYKNTYKANCGRCSFQYTINLVNLNPQLVSFWLTNTSEALSSFFSLFWGQNKAFFSADFRNTSKKKWGKRKRPWIIIFNDQGHYVFCYFFRLNDFTFLRINRFALWQCDYSNSIVPGYMYYIC